MNREFSQLARTLIPRRLTVESRDSELSNEETGQAVSAVGWTAGERIPGLVQPGILIILTLPSGHLRNSAEDRRRHAREQKKKKKKGGRTP